MENRRALRILIAEDEPIVLMGFEDIVKTCGYIVAASAINGEMAIEKALSTEIDMLIVDMNMPLADGVTVIREVNRVKNVPAILITGYRDKDTIERAKDVNVFGYLQKPVDCFEVGAAIEIAMQRFEETCQVQRQYSKAQQDLQNRKVIERAKYILIDKFGLEEEVAMKTLQKKSRSENKKLVDICRQIIEANERFMGK